MIHPVTYINFIEVETKKDGILYKTVLPLAQEAMSIFNIICQNKAEVAGNTEETGATFSAADEILKFKQLMI